MRYLIPLVLVPAFSLAAQGPTAMRPIPPYGVTHSWPIGGEGGWDYVVPDPARHRVFIGRSNRVMVVDERSGTLIGEVAPINGAHGVAIAERSGHGFATSGNDSSIVMFDLKTLAILGKVHAAEDADAIIYDASSNRVFSFNGDANSATVVDPRHGTLVTNIPLGGKPEYGASAGNGKVYVNLTDRAEVVEIDSRRLKVTRRWATTGCRNPVAMAIDVANHRLFSGCRSGVMAVSDYSEGTVIATLPIGTGVDGAAWDPVRRDAFASSADGMLTVIHWDGGRKYHSLGYLVTQQASRNVGLDASTHRLFLPGAKFGPAPAESTADNPRRRPQVVPGSFVLMVVEPTKGH
ncbi:MAG: hypothetical protein JWO05_2536 [Gemmatimonadetes bacterium]|nr:hypothetical protein [Gemmatimonadota bacterium]